MKRTELVLMVANRTGVDKDTVDRVLNGFTETVETALVCGEEIEVRGFGRFYPMTRRGTTRRHPGTGEPMTLPDKVFARFHPSVRFRKRLNP